MTGYTVHTGSSLKFSNGWDRVFEEKRPSTQTATSESVKKAPLAKVAKKSTAKTAGIKASKIPAKSPKKLSQKRDKKKTAVKNVKRGR